MLILDIVAGAETYHITKNKNGIWVGGTTFYKPKLEQADSVSLKLNDPFGGFGQINQGDIIILLDLFTDNNQWPPPYKISITAKYLLPNDTSSTVFTADGLLKGFDNTSVTYAVYDTENTDYLLDSAPDFGGETGRVYPLAIGTVTCKKPLRIGTGIEYKYHKAGIAGTTPDVDYHVFDNGVDICSNVTDNLDGTFNLSVTPVGDVRISGTGAIVDIDDLIDYCCGATKLNLTANKTYTRSPSPQLSAWIDKQELIIPFLDEVLSSFSHLFYITGSTLYLVDMFADNGTVNLAASGKEYYQSGYNYNNPLRSFITEWTTTDSGTDGEGYPTYVDDDHTREIIMSGYGATKKFNIIALNIDVANTALIDLATIYLRPTCTISIPPEFASSIKLGTLINFTDIRIPYDTDVSIRAREIIFNYDNHEIQVKGEGAIFNSPSVPADSLYLKRQRIDLKGYLDRISEALTLADGKATIFYQETEPTAGESAYGDLWIKTSTSQSYRYHNASSKDSTPPLVWAIIQDVDIATSLSDADYALAVADGKIVTFKTSTAPAAATYYQEGEPVGSDGEYWVKTSTQRLYKKVSGTWDYAPKYDEKPKIGDRWIYESAGGQVYNEYEFDTSYTEADTGSPAYNTHWKDVPDLRLFQYKNYVTVSTTATTGEYTTIESAVAALATGGTIFIKNGSYTIQSTIDMTTGGYDYEFIGETYGKVIINKGSSIATEGSVFKTDYDTAEQNISFKNLTYVNSDTKKAIFFRHYIGSPLLDSYVNLKVTDCTFTDIGGSYIYYGFLIGHTGSYVLKGSFEFNNLKFYNFGNAIYATTFQKVICNNIVIDSGNYGLYFDMVDYIYSSVYCNKVNISNSTTLGTFPIHIAGGFGYAQIENCIVDYGIYIDCASGYVKGSKILDGYNISSTGALYVPGSNIIIEGCEINSTAAVGVLVSDYQQGIYITGDNCTVSDCIINVENSTNVGVMAGIRVNNAVFKTIKDNDINIIVHDRVVSVLAWEVYSIWCHPVDDIVSAIISGNTCLIDNSIDSLSIAAKGLYIGSSSGHEADGVRITGNTFELIDTTRSSEDIGIRLKYMNHTILTGNYAKNFVDAFLETNTSSTTNTGNDFVDVP